MKWFIPITVACLPALVASAGCSTPRPLVINETVGPAQNVRSSASGKGHLIVYSAWDRFDTLDSEHPRHTPYAVTSETGKAVARVRNQAGSFGQDPIVVDLPAGKYWVEARATNLGRVRVLVVVSEGRSTAVYLDGTTAPDRASQGDDHWIRQPNGLIVGWKASEESQ